MHLQNDEGEGFICTLTFVVRSLVCYSYVSPTLRNSLAVLSRGSTDGDSWQAVLLEDIMLYVYRLLS